MKKVFAIVVLALMSVFVLLSLTYAQSVPLQTVKVNMKWTDNSDNEDGFQVWQCVGNGCTGFYKIGNPLPVNTVTYQDEIRNDPGERTVCYAITAFNAGGESLKSLPACLVTPKVVVKPVAPGSLVIESVEVHLQLQ
jgi:hypothetical protein